MEEKRYRSGYERYKEVAEMIKQQCSKLEGRTVKKYSTDMTQYTWNGFNVYIGNRKVLIEDKDAKIQLAVYDWPGDKMCQFAVEGGSNFDTGLTGCYYPKLSDSYVNSYYQTIYSDISGEKPFINMLPDDITTIIQTEIDKAEADSLDDEYDINLQAKYILNLKEGLDFFRNIVELAKSEKTQEETTQDATSSQQVGVKKILDFMEANGLSYNDLLLATVIKSGVKTSDMQNLQQALINAEQAKNGLNPDKQNSHDTEGK